VIRREDVPELLCIAVVEPVFCDHYIGAPQQLKLLVPNSYNRRHGLDCDHHAIVRRIFASRMPRTSHYEPRVAMAPGPPTKQGDCECKV
jgi:hypothetical protein